jgi:hypothetical protein
VTAGSAIGWDSITVATLVPAARVLNADHSCAPFRLHCSYHQNHRPVLHATQSGGALLQGYRSDAGTHMLHKTQQLQQHRQLQALSPGQAYSPLANETVTEYTGLQCYAVYYSSLAKQTKGANKASTSNRQSVQHHAKTPHAGYPPPPIQTLVKQDWISLSCKLYRLTDPYVQEAIATSAASGVFLPETGPWWSCCTAPLPSTGPCCSSPASKLVPVPPVSRPCRNHSASSAAMQPTCTAGTSRQLSGWIQCAVLLAH